MTAAQLIADAETLDAIAEDIRNFATKMREQAFKMLTEEGKGDE